MGASSYHYLPSSDSDRSWAAPLHAAAGVRPPAPHRPLPPPITVTLPAIAATLSPGVLATLVQMCELAQALPRWALYLTEVAISHQPLQPNEGLAVSLANGRLHALTSLRLASCRMGAGVARGLASALCHLPALTDLELSGGPLGDDGVADLLPAACEAGCIQTLAPLRSYLSRHRRGRWRARRGQPHAWRQPS